MISNSALVGVSVARIYRRRYLRAHGLIESTGIRQSVQQATENVGQHQKHDCNPARGAQAAGLVNRQTR